MEERTQEYESAYMRALKDVEEGIRAEVVRYEADEVLEEARKVRAKVMAEGARKALLHLMSGLNPDGEEFSRAKDLLERVEKFFGLE